MDRTAFPVALGATVFACLLGITSSHAQPARVFVAAQGNDANPCSFALPCRSFQHAHDTVAAGGEIDVLDPAGYGILNITKAISIQGHGFAGIAGSSANPAININAGASDKINLRGLLLDGLGNPTFFWPGIFFGSGGSLNIQDCLIRNFGNFDGIQFQPSASSSLFISDTIVSDNAFGIAVNSAASSTTTAVLTRVRSVNNGISFRFASDGTLFATVSDSVAAGNGSGDGIQAITGDGGPTAVVMVQNSTVVGYNRGLHVSQGLGGSSSTMRVGRSSITGNTTGLLVAGTLLSYGDNNIDGNGTDGTPSGTIPLK